MAESTPFKTEAEPIWLQHIGDSQGKNQNVTLSAIHDGRAEISADDGQTWKPALVGITFSPPTIIRTDARATVNVSFDPPGWILTLSPVCYLRIAEFKLEYTGIEIISKTMLELERGKLSGNLPKMSPASTFMIRTQKGIVEPFGQFEIAADGMVRADGGRVHADGATYDIVPGQDFLF